MTNRKKGYQTETRDKGQLLTLEAATDLAGQINSHQPEGASLAKIGSHVTNGRRYFQVNHETYSIGRA